MEFAVYAVPVTGVLALIFAFLKTLWVNKQDAGDVEMGEVEGTVHLLSAEGEGSVEYDFGLPAVKELQNLQEAILIAELSSRRPGAPQTSLDRWPAQVKISVNGEAAAEVQLEDQPADSRGALSHLHGFQGRYGYLTRVRLTPELVMAAQGSDAVRVRFDFGPRDGSGGGLAVYGSRSGRYPCDVTLVLRTRV